jgi:hypothetical protein
MTLRGGSPGRVFLDSHHHHTLHLPPTTFTSLIRSRASYQLRVRSRELSDSVLPLSVSPVPPPTSGVKAVSLTRSNIRFASLSS